MSRPSGIKRGASAERLGDLDVEHRRASIPVVWEMELADVFRWAADAAELVRARQGHNQ